jgi:hypothetical protein
VGNIRSMYTFCHPRNLVFLVILLRRYTPFLGNVLLIPYMLRITSTRYCNYEGNVYALHTFIFKDMLLRITYTY